MRKKANLTFRGRRIPDVDPQTADRLRGLYRQACGFGRYTPADSPVCAPMWRLARTCTRRSWRTCGAGNTETKSAPTDRSQWGRLDIPAKVGNRLILIIPACAGNIGHATTTRQRREART